MDFHCLFQLVFKPQEQCTYITEYVLLSTSTCKHVDIDKKYIPEAIPLGPITLVHGATGH